MRRYLQADESLPSDGSGEGSGRENQPDWLGKSRSEALVQGLLKVRDGPETVRDHPAKREERGGRVHIRLELERGHKTRPLEVRDRLVVPQAIRVREIVDRVACNLGKLRGRGGDLLVPIG